MRRRSGHANTADADSAPGTAFCWKKIRKFARERSAKKRSTIFANTRFIDGWQESEAPAAFAALRGVTPLALASARNAAPFTATSIFVHAMKSFGRDR
jgi:hypothetical protein